MIIDNVKSYLIGILFVSLLLLVCVGIDYADNITVSNMDNVSDDVNLTNTTLIGDTHYVLDDNQGIAQVQNGGKILVEKPKYALITVVGYPTCYTCWKSMKYMKMKRTYINYCPNCRRYGVLRDNPKKVADGEITCSRCDCDFCVCCGRDKVGSCGRHNWNILRKY